MRVPFVRDVMTMQVGQAIALLCGFLSSILLARLLGLGEFGKYAVILSFTGMFSLVTNLGQNYTTLTFLSEARARKNAEDQRKILHYYFFLTLCTEALLLLLLPFLPMVAAHLYGDASMGRLAQLLFLGAMADPFYGFVSISLQSIRQIRLLTILDNASIVFQLGISILLILWGFGAAGPILGACIDSFLFAAIGIALYPSLHRQHGLPSVGEILRIKGLRHIGHYAKQGIWITIDKSLGNLYPNLFLFILSTQATAPVVGLMRLAFKLAALPATIGLASVSKLAGSVIPQLAGKGKGILRTSIRRLATHSLSIHILMSAAAAIIVPFCIPYVYGPAYAVATIPFLVITVLNLPLVFHMLITPIVRVYSLAQWNALIAAGALIAAVGAFFGCSVILPPTISLYLSLTVYQCVSLLTAFPAWNVLHPHASRPST